MNVETIRIVSLSVRRIPEFAALLDEIARERRWFGIVEAPPIDNITTFVMTTLSNGGLHLAAIDHGQLVGWCDIRRPDRAGAAHVGVLGMGIRASHRGRGLGGRLVREAIKRATERNIERIELDVYASNTAARALYERAGFVVEGVRVDAWRLDDWHEDVVIMAWRRAGLLGA